MKKILIGFVLFLLAASAWGYIPPANLTVSGQGLSITGGTQAVNGTGTNITISKVASADYSTSSGSAGTASTAGYASTAGAASTALTAGVAAYAVLTGTASSTAHATTADYASLTAISSSCSGNANTVTNGVYTSNTYANPAWLSSVSYAVLSGTASSATSATNANYSLLSGTASNTVTATTANYAILSGTATNAASATTATNAAYATLTGTASTCSGNASNITGTLAVANGGTALTSYATGDVLYASGATTLSRKAIGAAGQALISRNGIPTWEALSGSGTVTQVNTGVGLTGGPITTTGTISIDSTVLTTLLTRSKIITSSKSMTDASGNVSYTGVGFEPSAIACLAFINAGPYNSIGFADANKTGVAMTTYGANTLTDNNTLIAIYSAGGENKQTAIVKSYDTDGFTLTWTKAGSPTGSAFLYFLCFR